MGHYSYMVAGDAQFFLTRDHYDEELAALFTESDRCLIGEEGTEFEFGEELPEGEYALGYYTTARRLRQRLSLQGFTSQRALACLGEAVELWRSAYESEEQVQLRGRVARGETASQHLVRPPRGRDWLLAAIHEVTRPAPRFDTSEEGCEYAVQSTETLLDIGMLEYFVEQRSLVRLVVDQAPGDMRVGLNLGELTGCCVRLDATQPVAGPSRERQLATLPDIAPLIVLTEGSTDSRVLTKAMHITHPHLVGFVRFIDYAGAKAEGSVGMLANLVKAFNAAGVANRFVAIADNDSAGHNAFAQLKGQDLPPGCKVLHYPDLPLLANYPTVDPESSTVSMTDVNGIAGSLEMYLGEDVLTIDGVLAPVHLAGIMGSVQRRQGALSESDKSRVQKTFKKKLSKAARDKHGVSGDWSGIHAILEHIIRAFD
uniref:HEPN/Toprim-associated domain-containing protein n=1 Tax=Streptomyces virginiae TaxID=1961 RepID=UPI002F9082BD